MAGGEGPGEWGCRNSADNWLRVASGSVRRKCGKNIMIFSGIRYARATKPHADYSTQIRPTAHY
eukprot:scaffold263505_cov23-Tisochrysis_lutea.AAC.1